MKFFKQHSYDVTKLLIYQVGIAIFGLILTFATARMDPSLKSPLTLIVSIFSVLFYLFLVYTVMWEIGSQDRIRVDAGRMDRDPLKGLKLSLLAQVPAFLLAFFLWLGAIGLTVGGGFAKATGFLYGISLPLMEFLDAMYLGIIMRVFAAETYLINALLFTVVSIPAIAVCTAGYLLGYADIRFLASPPKQDNR